MDDAEIDFVAKRSGGTEPGTRYVQVAYLLRDDRTVDRELGILRRIDDNYSILGLSLDTFFATEKNRVRHVVVWDRLLEER
jgi:predicted AAA+ superfamily ATPase